MGKVNYFKKTLSQMMRYGLVTVVCYIFIIFSMYISVELLKLPPNYSYLLILTLAYLGLYIAQTKFVFTVDFSKKRATKYALTLIIFWVFLLPELLYLVDP